MAKSVYFDTSIFIEMAAAESMYKTLLPGLLLDLHERKVHIYTSILTVQEMSVAFHRRGHVARDVIGDISRLARVYSLTKEIALTAGKREAELKDLAEDRDKKRDKGKPLTRDQELDQVCENRRRKWDCFHIATAQILECPIMYSTDTKLQKRPRLLGIKNLAILPPTDMTPKITGPLLDTIETTHDDDDEDEES